MYSVSDFGGMLVDEGRMQPYLAALKRHIRPDTIVLDIGTGTGIFALMACQFGARHVYAVEPSDAIEVGRQQAQDNGYASKITFIHDMSTKINLPEKANVIVSDLRGELPFCSLNIPSIIDARERHLAESGVMIPQRDTIRIALAHSPLQYEHHIKPWVTDEFNLDLQSALRWVNNTPWSDYLGLSREENRVGEDKTWVTLDYNTITSPNATGNLDWVIDEPVTAHGLRIWFDAELAEGLGFSNHPDLEDLVYGRWFLPFQVPVVLTPGNHLRVVLTANLVGDDYVWRWKTVVYAEEGQDEEIISFEQSSFMQMPLSLPQLRKRAANFKPDLSQDGELCLEVMTLMQQGKQLEAIAESLVIQFPDIFPNWQDALPLVGKLSEKYSK
jgi:protein arginine N-methyltransferase 1